MTDDGVGCVEVVEGDDIGGLRVRDLKFSSKCSISIATTLFMGLSVQHRIIVCIPYSIGISFQHNSN